MNLYSPDLSGATARVRGSTSDYGGFVAAQAAAQAVTPTALAEFARRGRPAATGGVEALIALIGARPGWPAAAAALGYSFNAGVARMLVETPREAL